MIVIRVDIQKILLLIDFIHSSWKKKLQQAEKIMQIGGILCVSPLQMNIGKQLLLRLKLWKHCSIVVAEQTDDMNVLQSTWSFKLKIFLMNISRSFKPICVL